MSQPHAPPHEHQVTPLELFFDLVFVFAVSQLSHHLLDRVGPRAAAETAVMLVAVFMAWGYTSWAATMLPADRPGTQWMLVAVMGLGLFMNAGISKAWSESAWAFVIPLLVIQLGRTLWTLASARDPFYQDHFRRVLLWALATTPLWVLGALAAPETRLAWWAAAAAVEVIGTWIAHPVPGRRLRSAQVAFDANHLLERCRLFLIIALGETVLTTGTAIAQAPVGLMTLVTGASAMVITVALYSLVFGRTGRLTDDYAATTVDPIYVSRHALNAVMVLVAGLIAVAVANELVIAHPHGHGTVALSLLLFGGPVLYLLAQAWYLRAILGKMARVQLIGTGVLSLGAVVTLPLAPYIALLVAALSIAGLAVAEWRRAEVGS